MALKKCRMSFPRRRESRKKYKSHPEFISGSTKKDAQNLFSMTRKSLDSRFHGNYNLFKYKDLLIRFLFGGYF
ncbi:hypothetical protein [Rickettsia endosymbiont of Orchestes rusci]|uniref:hypothetical protein n=1 Tax=Rickettsia endosymbiont of Orchestes rusci TaxID=3066250 RepID=UPI00313ED8A2